MLQNGSLECLILLVKQILLTATMMREHQAPEHTIDAVLHPLRQFAQVQWVQGRQSYVCQWNVTEQAVFSKDAYDRQLFMSP